MESAESHHMLSSENCYRSIQPHDILSVAQDGTSCSTNHVNRKSCRHAVDMGHVEVVEARHQVPHNLDMDGGYGWVVVIASFFVAFIVDGIGSSFGLLFPYILAKFESSAFVASFAGSVFVAFMIMGSISAMLVKTFGFRLVAITGSTFSCLAFVASMFSPNIYIFIVTFGLLAGCSCGLVFITSIIIVNEYFHQKRGIANGIICSGSGAGLLVLGPIINQLLDIYSLDGTLLLLAAVLLHMCVFAGLFRPPPRHNLHLEMSVVCEGNINSCSHAATAVAEESLSSNLSAENMQMFYPESPQDMHKVITEKTTTASCGVAEVVVKSAADPLNSHGHAKDGNFYLGYLLHHVKPGVSADTSCQKPSHGSRHKHKQVKSLAHSAWSSEYRLDSMNSQQEQQQQPLVQHPRSYSMFDIPTWCQAKDSHQVLQHILKCYQRFGDHQKLRHCHPSKHRLSQNVSVDQASNCYLAGSIVTLLNLHNSFVETVPGSGIKAIHGLSLSSMSSRLRSLTQLSGDASDKLLPHSGASVDVNTSLLPCLPGEHTCSEASQALGFREAVSRSACVGVPGEDHADVSEGLSEQDLPLGYTMAQLLCMPSFHCFCLGAALIQIGYPLAGTFLADYAYQFGLSSFHTAVLMGLLGGLNICGRLLAGALASLRVDPLLLNNVSLLLGGAACLLSPLYTQFWSLSVFACMFGFFLGFFPPLQPLIIVKHFGLDTLASAFGFLSTVKGVASILGAPLAGFIYDITGQYSMSFMFGGAVFVLSALVHCLMTCSSNKCWRRQKSL